jgi:nitrogen regulatory protein PII
MPTKLSTTVVSRISEVPNPASAQIIREFYQYTRESISSEKHMTNALIITVVNDSMEEKVIEAIRKNSNAHGKIFVSELKDAIDLKSGQRGESVLQK